MTAGANRTRESQWKRFTDSCDSYKLISLPASTHTVALYIAFLARSLEFSTISNYCSGVVKLRHSHDLKAPLLSSFEVREALAGMKRHRHERPNKRALISPSDLLKVFEHLYAVDKFVRPTFQQLAQLLFFLC